MRRRRVRQGEAAGVGPDAVPDVHERIAAVPYWHHRIEVAPGVVTPGAQDSELLLELLGLPDRCDGMRALDIGARDGYFSFELERRGAEVLAMDYVPPDRTGFSVACDLLGSAVEYRTGNVYDLSAEVHGTFDLVLFAGVLYHLRHPLLALDRIWDVCRPGGQLFLESHVIDEGVVVEDGQLRALASFGPDLDGLSLLQYFPGDSLAADPTNQFGPNMTCLVNLLRAAGFDVERTWQAGSRGGARAVARSLDAVSERAIDSAARWDPADHRVDPTVLSPSR